MNNTMKYTRKSLRAGTALHALALVGAGIGMIAVAAPAAAQDYSQVNATGRIQSTGGEPIAGATITVTSNDQGFTRTVTSNGDGSFRVQALPQGNYTFTVEASGYDTLTDNAVSLSQGQSANQFTLAAAGSTADGGDIVVTAGRVQVVDFDRNTTGAVINVGELATRVPVARDITSVILLAPGTALGDTTFGNLPSVAGSSVSENTFYVNGLNTTSFRNGLGASTVPFEFYNTVEVKNGGIPAEFGRFTGGFVNTTTKSGSNDFHGGITFNYEPNSLASDQPNTYATDNDSRFRERKDFIAQLSGPIIKDHLFFYGIYNSRDVQTGVGSTNAVSFAAPAATATAQARANSCQVNPTFCTAFAPLPLGANLVLAGSQYAKTRSTTPFYAGKLDAIIVDGQRLEFTYFNTGGRSETSYFGTTAFPLAGGRYNPNTNEIGLAVPGPSGGTQITRFGGENYVGRYTGTFTDWLTVSAAYGKNKNIDTTESSAPNFGSIADQRFGTTIALGNPVANTSISRDERTFYRADADLNFSLLGQHHIRGGYDREELESRTSTIANGNYQYTYGVSAAGTTVATTPAGTPFVLRRFFRNGGEFSTLGEAWYVQDSWSLLSNRVLINAGVRNDHFENNNASGQAFFNSKNNWSPRISASFDPIGDGQTKVYGSFSRYYLPVPLNTNIRLSGSELDYDQYYVLAGTNADNSPILGTPIVGGAATAGTVAGLSGGRSCPTAVFQASGVANCRLRNDGTIPTAREVVSQNLEAQSVDEYQVGFEQRLGRRWKVGAYYTQRDLRQSLEDSAIDNGVLAYCAREFTGAANAAKLNSCQSTFSGFHQYTLINPGKEATVDLAWIAPGETAPRNVTLSAADLGYPKATRKFKSMTLTVDREFDGKWSLSANYTISSTVGNIEGGVRSDNGQTDANLTTAFDVPSLVNGAYGYLPTHARHVIKAFGSYQLFDWLNIGANVNVVSPRKFGCIGTVPTSVDGGIAAAYGAAGYYCNVTASGAIATTTVAQGGPAFTRQLTPRGSVFQSDWQYNTNLDIGIKLPTDAFDGTLRVSVFNVFNSKAQTDFQEVGTTAAGAPSTLYSQVLNYQTPRFVRFQLGVNF